MEKENQFSKADGITLKEYFEKEFEALRKLMDERDRLYAIQFKAAETAVNAALAAQEKATASAFSASEKAIVKAEEAQKEYNVRSNEFRGQLDDQNKLMMPRVESISMHRSTDDKISVIQKSLEDKIADLQKSVNEKLEAHAVVHEGIRTSNEKSFENVSKEIAALREYRSEQGGKVSQEAINASVTKSHWAILFGIFGIIGAIISVIGMAVTILKMAGRI
jgi:hypothetical protein